MDMLAEPVVSFVVERLGDLLITEAKLSHGVSGQVQQIQTQLSRMQCFLRDADAKQDEGERVCNWIVEIREIAYETEDVIETFVLRVGSRRGGGVKIILHRYMGCCLKECIARHKIGSEIQSIKRKLSDLTQSLQTYGLTEREAPSSSFTRKLLLRRSYSNVVDDDFVGLEEDIKKLVELLVNEEKSCRVVSICGMGGSGKTTLARKVYNNIDVQRYFEGFAWVCISQQWEKEDVMRRILIKLVPEKKEEIYKMTDEELIRLLLEVQKKKCLVVLDDIWSMDAWDCLKPAFPIGKMGTKLLLTTRNKDVASHVDPEGFLHERLLDENEGWELLQKKAFTKTALRDDKMMELGNKMASRCGGLPLAVVVLGGILVSKHSWREWEMVHGNIDSYLRRGKGIGE
ncbi:hypothetical protein F0562_000535 [Nyssa sinensis]|uniref:AAA+ ATPase domain-containing protein n=1 Tax=Nyssa sinensis TaxID=561372 RepID=A0A5J5C5G7_9ASTE|nr:hypothetical protein F0562_000535 [Nyssa sinensis]